MERRWEDVSGVGLWVICGKRPGVCKIVIGLLCLLHWVFGRRGQLIDTQGALYDRWADEGRAENDSVLFAGSGSISLQAR